MSGDGRPEADEPPPGLPVGATVRDAARDRVGVVMGRVGPCVQLRPLGGGREWDATPDDVRLIDASEILSARLAVVNTRSSNPSR